MRFTPFSDPESVLDFLSTRQTDSGANLETSVAEILNRVASRTTILLVLCARSVQTRKDIEVLAGLRHRMTCYSPEIDSPADGSGKPMWIGYSADGVPS